MNTETQTAAPKVKWPDLSKDQKAWELAKQAAEPNEALTMTIARAQRFKEAL
jgi:hypothetical protein